jgi:predicted YcjX-like family ATPase
MDAKEYLKKHSHRGVNGIIPLEDDWHMDLKSLCRYMEEYSQSLTEENKDLREELRISRKYLGEAKNKYDILKGQQTVDQSQAERVAIGFGVYLSINKPLGTIGEAYDKYISGLKL